MIPIMATYNPNYPAPPPPPMTPARGSSSASNRYTPENYLPQFQPTPQQANAGYSFPYGSWPGQRPAPMMQSQSTGAYPSRLPSQTYPVDNTFRPENAATRPPYPTAMSDPYMARRPPIDGERRGSHSSHRSHHSHHSGRTGFSHHGHHSQRSYSQEREQEKQRDRGERYNEHHHHRRHSDYDAVQPPERFGEHHHHHHGKHGDYGDMKPLERQDTHRPTMGDTVLALFKPFKRFLEPRDKY